MTIKAWTQRIALLALLPTLITGAMANLLGNPGLEEALTGSDRGNWLVWGGAERLNWQVFEGTYSLCLKGNWCGFGYAGGEQRLLVNDSSTYRLSFMHYRDGGFSAGSPKLEILWRDAQDILLGTDVYDVPLDAPESVWTAFGPLDLTPPTGAGDMEVRFNFESIGSGGAFYADNLLLEEISAPPAGDFFRCQNGMIVDADGNDFLIRGLGISGWMMTEGYMWKINRGTHLNTASQIDRQIEAVVGPANAAAFWQDFRSNFLTDADLDYLIALGMNTVRLPFNYRMLSPENQEGIFDEAGFATLDAAINQLKNKGLKVILDMHSAPGGAASEASGDPEHTYWLDMGGWWQEHGVACLWEFNQEYFNLTGRTPASNQARTAAIWREIALRYANEEAIIGYELINEPHLYDPTLFPMIRSTLIQITEAIREVDQNHIIFVEGDMFAEHIDGLLPPWDNNMAIAFHTYWKPNNTAQIQQYLDARTQYNIPLWCSESGENSNPWAYEFIQLLEANNIGWSWWGWKKMDGYATGFSAPLSADQQYVVDNLWNPNVDTTRFMDGLLDIAENMNTANCAFKPGYFHALFDPESRYGSSPRPFVTHSIPGIIDCVNYDLGMQGVAYYDTIYKNTAYLGEDGNKGLTYRSDGVDILPSSDGCGYKVAYTDTGEWMKYTVNVSKRATYKFSIRATTAIAGSKIRLYANGKALTSEIQIPNTGGWDNWQTVSMGRARLNPGTQILEIRIVSGGADLSSLIVTQ